MASSKSPLLHRVRIQPAGLIFINGMSSAYETEFPLELSGVVSEADFSRALTMINDLLKDYWPCLLCFGCGYGCCICTLGLSLFCPNLCISDVRSCRSEAVKSAADAAAPCRWLTPLLPFPPIPPQLLLPTTRYACTRPRAKYAQGSTISTTTRAGSSARGRGA